MRHVLMMLCLMMAVPTFANEDVRNSNLDGVWRDRYDDDKIEIRAKRYGLEVKKKGLFRKKRIFKEVDYNRYADYDGNVIEVVSNNRIVWKNRRDRRATTFFRNGYSSYGNGRYDSDNRYNQSRSNYGNRGNRRYNNVSYNDSRYDAGRQGNYNGRWRSSNNNRNIFIETRGNGIRVRRSDSDHWYNYNRDPYESNVFVGNNGEKYIYRDDSLTWYGRNSCDSLRFGRY